ncbi:tyrosine-protein phosphatase [Aeromicrobium sp. CF3.5]|uniref:tyrosine-protein phosphatase n=1 Tax=Aeromicrobium sp. CF3.5 TaxID=3373078 RepID=UPI003EE50D9A
MTQRTPNLRDIGSTPTADGGQIRSGAVLRSALPFDHDVVDHVVWPPAVVLDLRSEAEIAQHPTLAAPPTVHLPLLASLRPESHLDGTLVTLYAAVLESAAPLLVEVVRIVADARGPVLIHCAAGKDRTGISVALLMRLVGVERDVVMADYVHTNEHIDAVDARLRALSGNERRDELPREYFHVVPAALDAVMDIWDAAPGGTVGWLERESRDLGGGDEDLVERLRQRLLISDTDSI